MTSSARAATIAAVLISLAVTGCTTTPTMAVSQTLERQRPAQIVSYAAQTDGQFPVAAIDVSKLDPRNVRQLVDYPTNEKPGTIVVDTGNRFIYLVQGGGKAMRYGVGVGREGLEFSGSANIGFKREWPRWTPTQDMIQRQPERYARWADGMDGGPANPLGARALYLVNDGKDTLYRIHGTNEPQSIGHAVSSGCIRMMNQDVIDLYRRVPAGSKVVVL